MMRKFLSLSQYSNPGFVLQRNKINGSVGAMCKAQQTFLECPTGYTRPHYPLKVDTQ